MAQKSGKTLILISCACAIFGLIFTACGFVSGPLGPWLSGYILDLTRGSYTIVFTYLGLMFLVAAAIILQVRPHRG